MNHAFQLPLNTVSFGQVSVNLLKGLFNKGVSPCVFTRGNVDLSAYTLPEPFIKWLQGCIDSALDKHNRSNSTVNLWHIHGLMESLSKENDAFTFHETNQLTPTEVNILSQQRKVFVSSNYTKQVFEAAGLNNVVYCPLGFDKDSFKKLDKNFHMDDIITFGICGKLEKRKHTLKVLSAWAKKYGGNAKYRLNCHIQNPHMQVEAQEAMINSAFNGRRPWNINFLGYQVKNEVFNDALNAIDINLTGMSGCEGFNLPLFQSLCIGKQAVVLNAHVHKDYCKNNNSFLVPTQGIIDAHDSIFFAKGQKFNQGTWFDFDEDTFIAAMELSEKKAKEVNLEGIKLSEEFTYKKTLEILVGDESKPCKI